MKKTSKTEKTVKPITKGKIAGIIGVTAAAAIGAYLAYDKKGTKVKINKAKEWMHDAKIDLMKKVKTIKQIDQKVYDQAVEQIVEKYKQVVHVAAPEVKTAIKDLKSYWKTIKAYVSTEQSKQKAVSKKATKTAPKKSAAKK